MKLFTIEENDAYGRLDRFLKKLLPWASASLVYKLNRKNKVKVNGKRQDNEYKLQPGEEVKIFLTDDEFATLCVSPKSTTKETGTGILDKKNIVYEDGDLLVVDKDAGVNVHPGDHKTKELSLISQVHDYLGNKHTSLTFQPSLVHRIDRNTSGIVMIAKQKHILTKLAKDFREHTNIEKTYRAFVFGKLPHARGKIDAKILRIENAQKENKVRVDEKGQQALTYYKVLGEWTLESITISEVEVEIHTGRMHQIRVHMAHIGCPIVGDSTYGDKQKNAYISKRFGLSRQALHAEKITFYHPGKKKSLTLTARLKTDMTEFLKKIAW